jgi:hypothetical protein
MNFFFLFCAATATPNEFFLGQQIVAEDNEGGWATTFPLTFVTT